MGGEESGSGSESGPGSESESESGFHFGDERESDAEPRPPVDAGSEFDVARVGLVALFVTSLVTAQLLAVKVVAIALPTELPLLGPEILVPAGVIAYAATFLATDCLAELYGHRQAAVVVNVGFGMILVMLALVWAAILAPVSPTGVDQEAFAAVMAPSTNIVLGGLLAYVVSQHWDVFAFDRIRRHTGRRLLWVRNLGSTVTSQAIDTVVFISIAFWAAPALLGIGDALPAAAVVSLILGQYLLKLLIALADTPFVYLIVGAVRRSDLPGVARAR